jgi:hypothetical protein
MPKKINQKGNKIDFHPIIIRFPISTFEQLKLIKESSKKQINEIVRDMVYRELQVMNLINPQTDTPPQE